MKRHLLFLFVLSLSVYTAGAQVSTAAEKEAAYTRTIQNRAQKIVAPLNITDSVKAARVTNLIAQQYRNLNDIHTRRDEQIKAVKTSNSPKEEKETQIQAIETDTDEKLEALHTAYLAQLSKELTPEQVIQVKDGMTYGVVSITYNGYLAMLPNLTEPQKKQIMAWLVEAREKAMDAESSEKKHWWFGKYKGRINNYLAAAGYDLKKAGEEWEKRRAEANRKQ